MSQDTAPQAHGIRLDREAARLGLALLEDDGPLDSRTTRAKQLLQHPAYGVWLSARMGESQAPFQDINR